MGLNYNSSHSSTPSCTSFSRCHSSCHPPFSSTFHACSCRCSVDAPESLIQRIPSESTMASSYSVTLLYSGFMLYKGRRKAEDLSLILLECVCLVHFQFKYINFFQHMRPRNYNSSCWTLPSSSYNFLRQSYPMKRNCTTQAPKQIPKTFYCQRLQFPLPSGANTRRCRRKTRAFCHP